jgi:eukaryotic-like serine/threonine-protein kinase
VLAGRVRPVPAGSDVPRWLRRVLLRGLAVNPSERYPDMTALLAALRPPSRPLRLAIGASAVVAVVALGFGLRNGGESHPLCSGADASLDAVWNADARLAGRAAFVGTEHPAAESTWARAEAKIDDYARRWDGQFASACRAANREGVTDLVERSFGCLRRSRIQLETLVGILSRADAETIPRAIRMLGALSPVEACTDPSQLTSSMALPEDAETRQAVEALREDVARVQIQLAANAYEEAVDLAREVLEAAQELSFAPLLAEAKLVLGEALQGSGDYEAAHDAIREAFFESQQADQHAITARAAQRLAILVGVRQGDHEQGLLWVEHARVGLNKIGASPARLLGDEAAILDRLGRYEDAIAKYEEALVRLVEDDAQPYEEAITHIRLGDSLRARGRVEEALDHYLRAETLFQEELGEKHPQFAIARVSKGTALARLGRTTEAIAAFEDGVERLEDALGPEHPSVATALVNLGIALKNEGEYDRAIQVSNRSLSLTIAAFGPEHRNVAQRHDALGRLLTKTGQPEEALDHHERALAIHETSLGASHPATILTLLNLGEARLAAGRADEALAAYERAHRESQALPEDDPMRADAAVYFGARLVEHGRAQEAVALLEAALPVLEPLDGYADVVALGRSALARAVE